MFDGLLPEIGELAALDDAAVVAAAGGWARVEAAACARKQAAMAELFCRRTGLGTAEERDLWWVDPDSAVAAELGAAQGISQGMALHQTYRGVGLRDRLPAIAALFAAGEINDLLVKTIVWRTGLITDAEIMAKVDAALAAQVSRWGPLSVSKTEAAIDAIVDEHDPAALRRCRAGARHRDVEFGSPSDEPGMTSLWGRLYAADAAVVEQRVNELAATVCPTDPRTIGERRADALTALAAGQQALACRCGAEDCPRGAHSDAPPRNLVVHVVADADTVTAAQTNPAVAAPDHGDNSAPTAPEDADGSATESGGGNAAEPAEPPRCDEDSSPVVSGDGPPSCARPAYVMGGGVLPAPLLAAMLDGAAVREVHHPGVAAAEPGYVPTRALADFVRCRDLTCRWPGCDKPATQCDIDHTVPFPTGPTHATNLKCLCRFHHRTAKEQFKLRGAPTHDHHNNPGCSVAGRRDSR